MDRFHAVKAFTLVIETGSFTGAARKLGVSPPAISKLIAQLEDSLGVRLLERTTRKVNPTAAGDVYYERCRRIIDELEDAEQMLHEQAQEPTGVLRVNAPVSFGTRYLGKIVADYYRHNPKIELVLSLTDRHIDPVTSGVDLLIRIRIAAGEDHSTVSRCLSTARGILCASPDYLAERGKPKKLSDLRDHQVIRYPDDTSSSSRWSLCTESNETVIVKGPISADNGDVVLDVARRGLGICFLPSFIARESLIDGLLVPILTEACTLPVYDIRAIYPSDRHLPTKTRHFVEFLQQQYGKNPPWEQGL
ncbi:LysR family transcriptional regulator [Gammaproteobacteria bacterium]|nr:LysR family transcriptional regulator [Gammaproteobacteria bacterium]